MRKEPSKPKRAGCLALPKPAALEQRHTAGAAPELFRSTGWRERGEAWVQDRITWLGTELRQLSLSARGRGWEQQREPSRGRGGAGRLRRGAGWGGGGRG